MSGNFESTQARNITLEGKCEGKCLSDLGHKMATSGFFKASFSSSDLKSHDRY